jgi:mannose-P-dolichol utilization defect protein 1
VADISYQIMITFLIVLFSSSSNRVPLLVAYVLVMALTTTLLSESIISPAVLKYLVASSIPLALSSKLPQILSNFRMGSTGQLSAFLVFNSLAGCAARVFTTATETGDPLLWWGFVLATALNGVLAIQMAAYWKGGEKERLTTGIRVPEKVLAHATGVQKAVATKVGGGERPTSPASPVVPGKRYVRKLE